MTPTATTATTPLSAEAFFEFVQRPENQGKWWELERGEVIEVPPPQKPHGVVCGNVGRILGNYGVQRGRGYVATNDTGLIVERNPDTVRGVDVIFYDDDQTLDTMERSYSDTPPRLVVEVRSPHDKPKESSRRIEQYLRMGIPLVWWIDPENRYMTVYQRGEIQRTLDDTDEVTGNSILPEFRCRVAEFFTVPGKSKA